MRSALIPENRSTWYFLYLIAVFILALNTILSGCIQKKDNSYNSWEDYLGGPNRNHYSTLSQIDTNNVQNLAIAWTYESPDSGQMQMNPIVKNGIVYGVTAALKAFALDAATGKELWLYTDENSSNGTCRGVAYWEGESDKRIFYTVGENLLALDASTGKLIPSFGENGKLNLHIGLPEIAQNKWITSTTPGTIYKNRIILPVRVAEDATAAPGYIRAFDVLNGNLIWTFHTIPHPGEKGYDTWPEEVWENAKIGAVNNWAGMALDKETGTLFIPLGSAAPDFYGGDRNGANLFANCLLALDAMDGSYKWHFQMTHHDLWDRDLPAPPNLIKVTKKGKKIDAVAQVTKQGFVFVFDRTNGEPLFPIEEMPVPPSQLEGEEAWATQPVPTAPKPFARSSATLTVNDVSPYAPNKDEISKILNEADKRFYAPPDTNNVLLFPGYDGGAEYGGAGADPENGILYVNANEMAWYLKMKKINSTGSQNKEDMIEISAGRKLYNTYCIACHGPNLKGNAASGYSNISSIAETQTPEYAYQMIRAGKDKMPGFPNISDSDRQILVDYLFNKETGNASSPVSSTTTEIYRFTGYKKFLDKNGLPAISPPWGTLTAIDLNSGDFIWQTTLGITSGLPDQDTNPTGCENYGGPVITKNGLLIIAGTKDGMIRAFNRFTGKLLWQTKLPAASFATPSTYSIKGNQFIVMACGGEKLGTPKGNKIIAFALPQN